MNYRDYVGREDEFDFAAATQFSLLFQAGLRGHHKVLDFGCGCLRLGRLLIPFLEAGGYHGFDPNPDLFEQFVEKEYSPQLIEKKMAKLVSETRLLENGYDFIVAHSVFTHTGVDLLQDYLKLLGDKLNDSGVLLATFYISPNKSNKLNGWRYKDCYAYTEDFVRNSTSLKCERLNWWHPRQFWYAFYKSPQLLPDVEGKPCRNISDLLTFQDRTPPDKYTDEI